MTFDKRLKDPGVMIRAGLVFLVVANVAQYLLRRAGADFGGRDWADALTGLAWGLSFGLLILGMRLRSRRGAGGEPNC